MWHTVGILDQRNYSFCQQGFPSFEVYLITFYLSRVCLRLLSFPVCADGPNSDSYDSREPRGVLRAAFKFLRHRCKLSSLSLSRPPPPRELARRLFWNTTETPLTSCWASAELFLLEGGWGGRVFEGGHLWAH